MREVRDKRLNAFTNFVMVGSAATGARISVHGISILKIWAQVGLPGGKMGTLPALGWIYNLHGAKGLLRGCSVAALRAFPHYGITFGVYDQLSRQLVRKPINGVADLFTYDGLESIAGTFASGAGGGVAATLVTHPLDVVKTRIVVQSPGSSNFNGAVSALGKIYAQEGLFRGVYRGLGISLLGAATFWGMLFEAWELGDQIPWVHKRPLVPFEWFIWPCAAVCTATVVSHPLDVLRRKYMAQSYILPRDGNVDIKFRNIVQLITGIYKRNGIFGFGHGLFANLSKAPLQLAAFWIMYKTGQMALGGEFAPFSMSVKQIQ